MANVGCYSQSQVGIADEFLFAKYLTRDTKDKMILHLYTAVYGGSVHWEVSGLTTYLSVIFIQWIPIVHQQ